MPSTGLFEHLKVIEVMSFPPVLSEDGSTDDQFIINRVIKACPVPKTDLVFRVSRAPVGWKDFLTDHVRKWDVIVPGEYVCF